jgi:hypothetical protein
MNFHHTSPILRIKDLHRSIEYYQNQLGFSVDWTHDNNFASLTRGNANILLCEGDQGLGKAWIYIGVGDCELLYQEYLQSGAIIKQKPTNFPWALEIQVEDLDENVIRFGSEPIINKS